MKVLVSGASGAIGAELVRGLVARGIEVRGLVLPHDPFLHRLEGVPHELVEADVSEASTLGNVMEGVHTVYHLAAVVLSRDPAVFERVNVRGTRNMMEAAQRAGVKHFIHTSSASVVYPRTTPYSRSKRRAEAIVRGQSVVPWTIVRPTLVYSDDGGQEFIMFLRYLQRFPLIPFIGNGRALKRPVYVSDLIAGLVAIAGNDRTFGKIYNLSGGEAIGIEDLARLLLAKTGRRRIIVNIPAPVCEVLAMGLQAVMSNPPLTWNMIAGLTQDADLDPAEATKDLGYRPMGVHEGLGRCSLMPR